MEQQWAPCKLNSCFLHFVRRYPGFPTVGVCFYRLCMQEMPPAPSPHRLLRTPRRLGADHELGPWVCHLGWCNLKASGRKLILRSCLAGCLALAMLTRFNTQKSSRQDTMTKAVELLQHQASMCRHPLDLHAEPTAHFLENVIAYLGNLYGQSSFCRALSVQTYNMPVHV